MSLELTVLILLVLGLAFMALEAFTPAFGLLGLGGAASFFAALMMMREMDHFMGIAVDGPLLTSLGVIGALVLAACAYFVRLAWKTRATAGSETMVGMYATVRDWKDGRGQVHVDGEEWAAQGPSDLKAGDTVRISSRDKLVLTVIKDA
ncbi:MAG: hypothetical protein EBQ96_04050 [Proteobacteria bacterium]|nr:hypothetical protein [Pseudomonadota bacterium]